MANILYYGNGECYLNETGRNIRGVQVHYRGSAVVQKTTDENFTLIHKNNKILIFPLTTVGSLSNLFNYNGEMVITRIIVCDQNAEQVACSVKQVMDYAELINSNAEDMTTIPEDLNVTSLTSKRGVKPVKMIENLHTSQHNGILIDGSGDSYEGAYHIHIDKSQAMTGAVHSRESKNLFPDLNDNILKGRKMAKRKRKSRKRTNYADNRQESTGTTSSGSSGGSY